jgi:putative CocE/NonD family hydrolase
LKLWAASNCPDTDWTAKLCVVLSDGLCVNLTYGIMRARYRNGFDSPTLIEPGKPYLYEIKLNPTGILFKRGQRVRLYVSSSDFPNFDRNHNTGRDYWSDTELRVAHQTVFHAGDMCSSLILPIIPRETNEQLGIAYQI